jgi:hypothetical protein
MGLFAEPLAAKIRRRIPNFAYEGDMFLLCMAGVVLGIIAAYLLTRP